MSAYGKTAYFKPTSFFPYFTLQNCSISNSTFLNSLRRRDGSKPPIPLSESNGIEAMPTQLRTLVDRPTHVIV